MYYLGLDSGGTKAAFVLGDEKGNIYARYRSSGCAVLGARKEGVKKKVEEGVAAVCRMTGIERKEIECMAIGISGYGEGAGTEQETLEACEEVLGKGKAVCHCDTYVGWAGSFLFRPGINIISGTGAVVYGVNESGKEARSNASVLKRKLPSGCSSPAGKPAASAVFFIISPIAIPAPS